MYEKKWETKSLARILGSFVELLLFVGALKRLPTTPRDRLNYDGG